MKSAKHTTDRKSIDAVLAFVDVEIAKIVRSVVLARRNGAQPPLRPRPKPTAPHAA